LREVIVRVENVVKKFGEVMAVNNVSIEVFAGEFFSILGPSGCGKTTLLRSIAGLEEPDSGTIYLSGKPINSTPPYQRDVNMVFQNYALFPHMNVYENVAFGLKVKKIKKDEIKERVFKSLELVGLSDLSKRSPKQLSGGQQQRIALARALVNEPSVLLLDEPLGALDLKLRKQMQLELKSLQKRLGITFIYVTHDQEEALTMSDRIAIICEGKLDQVGTPSQVYEEPKTEFVANFIGISNIFPVSLRAQQSNLRNGTGSTLILTTPDGFEIKAEADSNADSANISFPETATAMVRPEKIRITPYKPECENSIFADQNVNLLRGKIEEIVYLGTVIQFIVNLNEKKLVRVLEKNYSKTLEFAVTQEVFVSWDISSTVILPGTSF
jgi:spermidine/putrescine transport system ATP-binding protein